MPPRASKTKTSWRAKQKKKPRKKQPRQKVQYSDHPIVNLEKETGPMDADTQYAMLAGFRAEHCGDDNFSGREIAKVALPNGNVRRAYACDVCGSVRWKETKT